MTFELYSYRNESYGETTAEFTYETGTIAHFNISKNENRVDGMIDLRAARVGLRIQSVDGDGALGSGAYYESKEKISYEKYIGLWQFRTANDGLIEMEVKEIRNGKITFKLFVYRNETYPEQTADFTYETGSIANFNVEQNNSKIDGTIFLKDSVIILSYNINSTN